MCAADDNISNNNKNMTSTTTPQPGCGEKLGNAIDDFIRHAFYKIGLFVANKPKLTIALSILFTVICGAGLVRWETENRPEELWVPQGTRAEQEDLMYSQYFPSTSRISTMIVSSPGGDGSNVLVRDAIVDSLKLHTQIATTPSTYDNSTLVDLCTKAGGSCVSSFEGVCSCLMPGILRQWNYDLDVFQNDTNFMATLQQYGSQEDLEAVLGGAVFDDQGTLISAEAFQITYFLDDRSVEEDGTIEDPINEAWEKDAFLDNIEQDPSPYTNIQIDYFATRSFADEFGSAITGDLTLVNVSYVVVFLFLGATFGRWKCGPGSRWSMSLAALFMIGLATAAGFGISSAIGLFFSPVHQLLPFVLLGIGVDDGFVIINAFDQERKVPRAKETDEQLVERCARGLSRAGASITVTSMTDLVAFAISSASALPALASFCAYASVCITFLWIFASTFFTACLVLDERRQRDNRRDCLCCLQRKRASDDEDDVDENDNEEGFTARYFRNYHAPAILSPAGKMVVLALFAGLLGFGIYGALNLSVENTELEFLPAGSYVRDYVEATNQWYADEGASVYFVFENNQAGIGNGIYDKRSDLAALDERLAGKSTAPPYISEPTSEEAYRNVMTGLEAYLLESGTDAIGGAEMGSDGWPATYEGFLVTLENFIERGAPGSEYTNDVSFVTDAATNETRLEAYRVESEYVRLTKERRGETIENSDKQIDAMDATRDMIDEWNDLPPSFVYSDIFLAVEGFKVIRAELFQNVGLAILAVAIIVLLTVASFVTSVLITLSVVFCIVEILGCMWAAGIAIDSVSVINITLAIGLSVDYSAHVGHTFMLKGGNNKDRRVTETLADMGAAVLNGATTTFLAVAVLLGSKSYVFDVLSKQFAFTVVLGVSHGLILLPVMLSLVGPKPFAAAEDLDAVDSSSESIKKSSTNEENGLTQTSPNDINTSEDDQEPVPHPMSIEEKESIEV